MKGRGHISRDEFSRRGSSGVDLRWQRPKEHKEFISAKKDELLQWESSSECRKTLENPKKEIGMKERKEVITMVNTKKVNRKRKLRSQ